MASLHRLIFVIASLENPKKLLHANCTAPVTGPLSNALIVSWPGKTTSIVGAASWHIDPLTCVKLSHHTTNLQYAV